MMSLGRGTSLARAFFAVVRTAVKHLGGAAAERVVHGVHGGAPRAPRSALTSDGAARVGRRCGPPWASRGEGSISITERGGRVSLWS